MFGLSGIEPLLGVFKAYFDFQNFHLTTRLRWQDYYIL
jgi:hypothetical protein